MTLVLNGTTGISAVDGSASTPAIQGNDTNTGIFFPAADTVAIAAGGTQVFSINGSGISANGSSLTNLNASNLSSGTVPDARFPATLPAASGANLTSLNASNLSTGTIPTGILAVTQAAKTATTTIATTAFVDQLRSLLTQSTASGGGTLVIGDRGTLVSVTAGVTVPADVFAANDVVTIYNNSSGNITITQGGSLTLRQVGTANTGNRTLAQRGLVTVVFISATEAVISGGGLT